jgi:hypothetical protein
VAQERGLVPLEPVPLEPVPEQEPEPELVF